MLIVPYWYLFRTLLVPKVALGDYIHVGLSLCDLTAASFFLFHLFLSYPWFTTTGPLALFLSNRAQVFMLAAPSFPPFFFFFFFGLWFLQLHGGLTALSLIEILFPKVDNLTKHCFFSPLVLIPHFQIYHLRMSQSSFQRNVACRNTVCCVGHGHLAPNQGKSPKQFKIALWQMAYCHIRFKEKPWDCCCVCDWDLTCSYCFHTIHSSPHDLTGCSELWC